ncbi:hypothetical protein [Ponticaulis profundi]|uniref:hypothetical protein n=1 Tax=Ponticaulis profundi TaxID=2665222 RepID=UPI00366FAFC9
MLGTTRLDCSTIIPASLYLLTSGLIGLTFFYGRFPNPLDLSALMIDKQRAAPLISPEI